jgi:hypothetical protein
MNKHIQTAIDAINGNFPSVYSKEDVVKVLADLNEALGSEEKPAFDFQKIYDDFENRLGHQQFTDVIDHSTAEFSIDYQNRLILDNIDIDSDSLTAEVCQVFRSILTDHDIEIDR